MLQTSFDVGGPKPSTGPLAAGKAVLLAASTLTVMSGATISPSLPAIGDAFSTVPGSEILIPLVLTVPALLIAICAFVMGHLVDRYGRLRVLSASLVLYAVAGSSGLWVRTLGGLLAGRAFLGVAVAGTMTASLTLIADYFHGEERRHFMGLMAAYAAGGGIVCILAGGFLADVHWRAPFAIYLLSLGVLAGAALYLHEPPRTVEDPVAMAGLAAPWKSVSAIYSIALLGMLLFYLTPTQLPFLLRRLGAETSALTGFALATSTFCATVVSTQFRRIGGILSHRALVPIHFGGLTLAYGILAGAETLPVAFVSMVFVGTSMGLMMPNLNTWLAHVAPERIRGRLMGGLTASIFFGQFLSPLAVWPFAAGRGYSGMLGVFGAGAWISLAAFLVAGGYLLLRRPAPPAPEVPPKEEPGMPVILPE